MHKIAQSTNTGVMNNGAYLSINFQLHPVKKLHGVE